MSLSIEPTEGDEHCSLRGSQHYLGDLGGVSLHAAIQKEVWPRIYMFRNDKHALCLGREVSGGSCFLVSASAKHSFLLPVIA